MPVNPKYRALTQDELGGLEKEFVDYLIVNGITADDWVKIKDEEKDKAEDIIVLFSDVVFEGVMRKVKFLEFREKSDLKAFQCLEEKIILVGMMSENREVDFTENEYLETAAQNPPGGVKVYTTEKPYSKVRELELFEMIQAGCSISDGRVFKALLMAMNK